MEKIKTLEKYPYLYETHLHTNQGSACGHATGAQMAQACKNMGYTGMIVTDHNWGGNTCVNSQMPWREWLKNYTVGYKDAKKKGDQIDLQVFFGYEAGFEATDFLIYGVDEAWMLAHEEIRRADVHKHHQMIREAGGLVIHAHPFREEDYIPKIRLFPADVDGVEGINAAHSSHRSTSHNEKEFDTRAIAYAKEHHLPMTAGSDIHQTQLYGGGMAFCHKLKSIQDFIKAIRSGEEYLLTNGEKWYTKDAEEICNVEYEI